MLIELRKRTALKILVLTTMAMATFAPQAYAYYRCSMMGDRASPCCGEHAGQARLHERPEIRAEPCCAKITIALQRVPAELNGPAAWQPQPVVSFNADLPVAEPPAARGPSCWTRGHSACGPPIIAQTCSRLI